MKNFVLLSAVFLCLCGCGDSDKDEIYNENNTTVKNGVVYDIDEKPINGLYKVYYANGNVKMEVQSKNGVPDGEGKFYDENGNIQFAGNFVGGKIEGKFYNYYEDGSVHNEMNYKNGEQDGEQKLLNPDGSLSVSVMVENGKVVSGYAMENGKQVPFTPEELAQVMNNPAPEEKSAEESNAQNEENPEKTETEE